MTDKPFNRYFLRAVDGFIYMSEQVHRELRRYTQVPALFSPHPLSKISVSSLIVRRPASASNWILRNAMRSFSV